MTADARSLVQVMLAAAGLRPSEAELAALVENYPAQRAGIESLYELPGARYEDHGLVFEADPPLADWRWTL
jgi:hypothetical protein